jgi:hypothetical protein
MILRGIIIAASGFLFIFSPGLPIGLLSRHSPPIDREMIYWGIGLWLVALLPSLFLQSLLRQVWIGDRALTGEPLDYIITLLGALVTATIVTGAMVLVLRRRKEQAAGLLPSGLALGFGVGLVAQVFTGLSLVGAGFRLMYGQVTTSALSDLASASLPALLLGLLAIILFRPAVLLVSAVQGVLASQVSFGGWGFFILAMLVSTLFTWMILALQFALVGETAGQLLPGSTDPLISGVTILYYLLVLGLAYRWLARQLSGWNPVSRKGKRE